MMTAGSTAPKRIALAAGRARAVIELGEAVACEIGRDTAR